MNSSKIVSTALGAKGYFGATDTVKNILPPAFMHVVGAPVNVIENVPESIKGFHFEAFYHPYIELLLQTLNEGGLYSIFNSGLLDKNDKDANGNGSTFKNVYNPSVGTDPNALVQEPLPAEDFNFDISKPLAMDNWFTFYHLIILIVETLLDNNKNDEAIKWIENCLYDPKAIQVDPDPQHPDPNARFWKLPIFKNTVTESTTKFFNGISDLNLQGLIGSLNKDPLNPFLFAYYRPQEFMMYVVTLYIKANIAQGDVNFRMAYNGGGMDYLNLALEYYKTARIQLGVPPQTIPNILKKRPETYRSLKVKGLDADSNVKVQYENIFPFCSQATLPTNDTSDGSLLGGGLTFYFSIPADNSIQDLFALIDDRLFKVRNCQDIDGIVRKIDLFGTPINPAQLLAALARGLSLGDILGGLYSPAPVYRFNFLLQKAIDICNEVKSLGSGIVSAIEKGEAEQLAYLRSTNESHVLNRLSPIKERQVLESNMQKQALLKTRETTVNKLTYYQGLLGIEGQTVPAYPDLPPDLNAGSPLPPDTIIPMTSTDVDVTLVDSDTRGVKIIPKEQQEIKFMNDAAEKHDEAGDNEQIAAIIHAIPDFSINVLPVGCGSTITYGSANIASIYSAFARDAQNTADKKSHSSGLAAKFGSYIRREQEWTFQANLAAKEIIQIDKQLAAADIRLQIAQIELDNHKKQIDEAQKVQDFLVNKESNSLSYAQIINSLKPIHKNFYDLAMYYARSAEQAYQFEKPEKVIDFISYNYDNSIMGCSTVADGLLSSLRNMEKSYSLDTIRPHEMRISIQLSRLDPVALLQLRKIGKAIINVPEWLLLLKNRRIFNAKWISVNFTFPMISGPYTNVNAVVTMQDNYIRIKDSEVSSGSPQNFPISGDNDTRFVQSNTPFKEIIVSTGINDPGYNLDSVATTNEIYQQQYHHFVHSGFISEWNIDLNSKTDSSDFSELNWDSLTDVIITGIVSVDLGDANYQTAAEAYLNKYLFAGSDKEEKLMLLLDLKHDFANELYKFKSDIDAQSLSFTLEKLRFPYIAQIRKITVTGVTIITKDDLSNQKGTVGGNQCDFKKGDLLINDFSSFALDLSDLSLVMDNTSITIDIPLSKVNADDSFIILNYTI